MRADTPLTLSLEEIKGLQSMNDRLSLEEVVEIYLPLSRLLALYTAAAQGLYKATQRFSRCRGWQGSLCHRGGRLGRGGEIHHRARARKLLTRWPNTPKVSLITTDGFLYPNAELRRLGLMERKGFPESYDSTAIVKFLAQIKAGERNVPAPLYSHLVYDVLPGEQQLVDRPDILIFEGLNVLQPPKLPRDGKPVPYVSDFLDFSIYIDADEDLLRKWYVDRFMALRETAFRKPESFFHRYASIGEAEALATAHSLWDRINLPNLRENIFPTRPRADLILRKGLSHTIEEVALRKL